MSDFKPWEETWEWQGNDWIRIEGYQQMARFDGNTELDGKDDDSNDSMPVYENKRARARLASAAPDMARVLLATEWVLLADGPIAYEQCPSCRRPRFNINIGGAPFGHSHDCALAAALRKAGAR